jgi:Domain of unknown function (DUF397)
MEAVDPRWRKASYSGNGGDCVEVGTHAAASRVLVRDTKDTQGPVLRFTSETWRKFANRVKGLLGGSPAASQAGRPRPVLTPCHEALRQTPGGVCLPRSL